MGSEPTIHLSKSADALSDVVFIAHIEMLGDRATKNFRGHIRARDQKHNLGIGVIGGGLKERSSSSRTGSFRNYMLVE